MSDTKTEETKVKFLRLSNGEDIIAVIKGSTRSTFLVENPMRVIVDADLDAGKQTIYMHNWMPQGIAKDNGCNLNLKDIIFTAEVEEDIIDYYKGVVFEMIEDRGTYKRTDKKEKVLSNNNSKVITFPGTKNSIE
jgi:hypothetical protein